MPLIDERQAKPGSIHTRFTPANLHPGCLLLGLSVVDCVDWTAESVPAWSFLQTPDSFPRAAHISLDHRRKPNTTVSHLFWPGGDSILHSTAQYCPYDNSSVSGERQTHTSVRTVQHQLAFQIQCSLIGKPGQTQSKVLDQSHILPLKTSRSLTVRLTCA